jgi:hypothetical protein
MMPKEGGEEEKLIVPPGRVSSRQEFRCILGANDAKNGVQRDSPSASTLRKKSFDCQGCCDAGLYNMKEWYGASQEADAGEKLSVKKRIHAVYTINQTRRLISHTSKISMPK